MLRHLIRGVSEHPSDLSYHTGYWLRILSNHVSGRFSDRLRRHRVSVPQWNVLRVVYGRGSLSLKEIADTLDTDQGALSRMIERLLNLGLVTRVESLVDRRAVAISLTKEGTRLVPKLSHEADENDRAFFGSLSERELKAFQHTIHKLLSNNPAPPKGSSLQ